MLRGDFRETEQEVAAPESFVVTERVEAEGGSRRGGAGLESPHQAARASHVRDPPRCLHETHAARVEG